MATRRAAMENGLSAGQRYATRAAFAQMAQALKKLFPNGSPPITPRDAQTIRQAVMLETFEHTDCDSLVDEFVRVGRELRKRDLQVTPKSIINNLGQWKNKPPTPPSHLQQNGGLLFGDESFDYEAS